MLTRHGGSFNKQILSLQKIRSIYNSKNTMCGDKLSVPSTASILYICVDVLCTVYFAFWCIYDVILLCDSCLFDLVWYEQIKTEVSFSALELFRVKKPSTCIM